MRQHTIDPQGAIPMPMPQGSPAPDGLPPTQQAFTRKTWRGRRNHFSGLAAEHSVARQYQRSGARLCGHRVRTPEGELDLVVQQDGVLVFVEVKKRSRAHLHDSPISGKQWRRLENAALHYMMEVANETGVQPYCRFDVALVGPDGGIDIIENARSFDAQ